jgi:hypothetical protein
MPMNREDIGMKSRRALFQIVLKQILSMSGAMKDRSMTEVVTPYGKQSDGTNASKLLEQYSRES